MKKTGTISDWFQDKSHGFIREEIDKEIFFLHKKDWREKSVHPKKGLMVEFEAVAGNDKYRKAVLARSKQTSNPNPNTNMALTKTIQLQTKQSNNTSTNPYHFVKLTTENSVSDTPIWHDGKNSKALLSGEIRISLKSLTPLLVGQWQYQVKDLVDRSVLSPLTQLDDEKNILEPLRLSDGRVVLPGSSVKGMIRHSLSALLSAPMERVAERSYSYRPNAKFSDEFRKPRPAIIVAATTDKVSIRVLPTATSVYFVRGCALTYFDNQQSAQRIVTIKELKLIDEKRKRRIECGTGCSIGPGYYVHYDGGIDGYGILHRKFKEGQNQPGDTYRAVWIEEQDYNEGRRQDLPAEAISHYLKTLEHLLADHGHFASGYPGEGVEEAKKKLEILGNRWQGDRQTLVGRLIYVELEDDEITSFGHHYYYRWRYANTIRTKRKENAEFEVREILRPLTSEGRAKEDGSPKKLSATRLLFGYTSRTESDPLKQDGTANIGQKDFQRLAGRIQVNSALEVLPDNINGSNNQRFLAGGKTLALQPLGQPRPSAVEHYLDQPRTDKELKDKRKDGGQMLTYGDLLDKDTAGMLAGRKFYLHQPDAAKNENQQCYEATEEEHIKGKQAALARFASKPGTAFRLSLRFKDLRSWELGALLVVLEPAEYFPSVLDMLLMICLKPEHQEKLTNLKNRMAGYKQDQPLFAHKLGYARPLGFGSVLLTCDAMTTLNADQGMPVIRALDVEQRQRALGDFAEKWAGHLSSIDHIEQWCAVHQYAGRTCSEYPAKDGKIFKHHSDARTCHILARRLKNKAKLSDAILKPLKFDPPQ
jgi:CRISPR-associated protein (TIGR03986 family)